MLLYTDGLIENPAPDANPRRWGETGLLDWLDEHGTQRSPQQLADRLLDAAGDQREPRDDIAIIALQLGAARPHQSPVPS
jgi:serine phosphatase RsbU (regulator of sigma subunit)